MANIRTLDLMLIEELFEMKSGWLLDFSNRTMAHFFASELNIDINDEAYAKLGTSKAKRLRCYLDGADVSHAVTALKALWEYRQATRVPDAEEKVVNAEGRFLNLIQRMQGLPENPQFVVSPKMAFDHQRLSELKERVVAISQLAPQPRGYAFEAILKDLFAVYGLNPREAFRLTGEQIDGSFDLASETYLLEAKWQDLKVGIGELHTFHGKVEQKAAWTRGLIVSHSGFTEEGLHAFGRGKRVICMDGLDLYDILNRGIPLSDALQRKVRRAAETGIPFVPIRELFD